MEKWKNTEKNPILGIAFSVFKRPMFHCMYREDLTWRGYVLQKEIHMEKKMKSDIVKEKKMEKKNYPTGCRSSLTIL